MKLYFQKILGAVCCAALVLSNLGCPIASSSEASFEEMYYDFVHDLKGFCLFWYRDVATLNPRDIYVSAPPGFNSFGFGTVGRFGINTDLDGPDEFWFNVVGNGTRAFIDFQFDNIMNGDDIEIRYNSSMSRLEVTDHPFAGLAIGKGFYYLQFSPDVFPAMVSSNFSTDITVDLMDGSTTSRTNRLMLKNAWILPHVVYGQAGDLQAMTDIIGNNANAEPATVRFDFFTQTGNPLDVTIDEVTGAVHTCVLGGGLSKRVHLGSMEPLTTGWGIVSSDRPISAAEAFTTFRVPLSFQTGPQQVSEQTLVGEAGISATGVSLFHVVNVASSKDGLGTAIAIANPTAATASMTFALKDAAGEEVATGSETLDAKNQTAQFFQDFVANAPDSFSGTLTINSDTDIAVISLETLDFFQQASLPSGNRTAP